MHQWKIQDFCLWDINIAGNSSMRKRGEILNGLKFRQCSTESLAHSQACVWEHTNEICSDSCSCQHSRTWRKERQLSKTGSTFILISHRDKHFRKSFKRQRMGLCLVLGLSKGTTYCLSRRQNGKFLSWSLAEHREMVVCLLPTSVL